MDTASLCKLRVFGVAIFISLLSGCVGSGSGASGQIDNCPQPRFTEKAPDPAYSLGNPLEKSATAIEAGEVLYQKTAGRVACMKCHGKTGDGAGVMAKMFDPPPRNFRCAKTINGVPDGQLFWIIKNGSPETSMPAFHQLSDEQIWQLVHYIRELSKATVL